jgi:serine palmitoyltransferase
LNKIKATDKRLGRESNAQRRFIVVEGLYKNSGTIVPFDELVALKHEYCYRLIVDESFSFGTLGKTGRGVIEMANKRYMYDAEIVTISLENALGSIGGVTVGNEEVVDHQRLSGAGYCFSASSPPFTASAAIQALAQLENRPELLGRLNENKEYLYEKLTTSMKGVIPEILVVTSDKRSPIVFLELADGDDADESKDVISLLDDVAHELLQKGVAIVSTGRHLDITHVSPSPALRLTVSAVHTKKDIDQCLTTLKAAAVNKKARAGEN